MKNKQPENQTSQPKNTNIENSPVLQYTLEKAINTAIEQKNLKGLTLWPTDKKGWQGNAQNKLGGWSVQLDNDPTKALLKALAGVIGA